jgi:hypothetical protein
VKAFGAYRLFRMGEYTGTSENGRYQGKGVYKYEGTLYEGNFDNGEFSGEGRLTMPNGNFYSGRAVRTGTSCYPAEL